MSAESGCPQLVIPSLSLPSIIVFEYSDESFALTLKIADELALPAAGTTASFACGDGHAAKPKPRDGQLL